MAGELREVVERQQARLEAAYGPQGRGATQQQGGSWATADGGGGAGGGGGAPAHIAALRAAVRDMRAELATAGGEAGSRTDPARVQVPAAAATAAAAEAEVARLRGELAAAHRALEAARRGGGGSVEAAKAAEAQLEHLRCGGGVGGGGAGGGKGGVRVCSSSKRGGEGGREAGFAQRRAQGDDRARSRPSTPP